VLGHTSCCRSDYLLDRVAAVDRLDDGDRPSKPALPPSVGYCRLRSATRSRWPGHGGVTIEPCASSLVASGMADRRARNGCRVLINEEADPRGVGCWRLTAERRAHRTAGRRLPKQRGAALLVSEGSRLPPCNSNVPGFDRRARRAPVSAETASGPRQRSAPGPVDAGLRRRPLASASSGRCSRRCERLAGFVSREWRIRDG